MSCIICVCVTVIALDDSKGVGPVADAVEIGSLEHEAVLSWRLQQVQIFFFFQSMALFCFFFSCCDFDDDSGGGPALSLLVQ